MVKKQQSLKKNAGTNVNEYKMIKNQIEMEESECLNNTHETDNNYKEIQEMHKEVINLQLEDDHEKQEEENIDDLKASILNVE
jgi:hypothetical protein